MDLNTVTEVLVARSREELPSPRPGDAFLAGGTALYGSPQPELRRLIDLSRLGWEPITETPEGLSIAATCTVAALSRYRPPAAWTGAGPLIAACCDAFLASFKIWNRGTVGGNLCMAYPAGPMISLAAACDGSVLVWRADGTDVRIPVVDFVVGDTETLLRPGDVLRSIDLPAWSLAARFAVRKQALAPLGRSSAVLVARSSGAAGSDAEWTVTVSASSKRPYLLRIPAGTVPADLTERIDDAVRGNWVDDLYGAADWRRHITGVLAAAALRELGAPADTAGATAGGPR